MKKEFVPYELALNLRALGFDEECINFWYPSGTMNNSVPIYGFQNWYKTNGYLNAPLWQQAFDWFREKYRLNSFQDFYPTKENPDRAYFKIENHDSEKLYMDEAYLSGFFDNFEEARLGCLKKLIELIKVNGNDEL